MPKTAKQPRQIKVGDEVKILFFAGAGGYGIVMETGIQTPFTNDGIRVARLDGTGEGIYTAVDLRWMRSGN